MWIFKVGHTVLARLIESEIWHQPPVSVREGGLSKGTEASLPIPVTDTSVSPCVPLLPFKLPHRAGAQRELV